MKVAFHFVICIFRIINVHLVSQRSLNVKSQKCILAMLMTMKRGILYTEHEENDREDMEVKPKEEQGRVEVKRKNVRKNGGSEKGSKLPDVKFFATNQRGDN